jgi:hypothetical protein
MPSSSRRSRGRGSPRNRGRGRGSPRSRGRRNKAKEKQAAAVQEDALRESMRPCMGAPEYAQIQITGEKYGVRAGLRVSSYNAEEAWLRFLQLAPTGTLYEHSHSMFLLAFWQGFELGSYMRDCEDQGKF